MFVPLNLSVMEKNLRRHGVQCRPYFPPIHLQRCYRELFNYRKGDFPVCEKMSSRTLAIPFYTSITPSEQEYVIENLAGAMKEG